MIFFLCFLYILTKNTVLSTEICDDCLLLTPLIKNGSTTLARSLSKVDPLNFLGVESHSGYITVNEKFNSNLFFWFFPANETKLENTPWIIWLQGGPGFSSLMGLFHLLGPFKVENNKVQPRDVTWCENYSMLFIDNPVGAGFSFTTDERGYPVNEDDVGAQLYEFLQQFLQVFPELHQAPLFISGESYAGKYVPALGIQIHRNKNASSPINFKGITIGNGLIDLRSMMHYSNLCEVTGILEGKQIDKVKELEENVVKLIDENKMVDASNAFNATIEYIKKQSGVDIYNFCKEPSSMKLEFEEFLKKSEVRRWIHAGNATFDLNNQLVYENMLADISNSTKPWIDVLLEHYGVMCYSGQLDIILAYSLSKHTYALLQWPRREEYVKAPRVRLRRNVNSAVVGYKKSGGNFVEVLVRNAGHMVTLDQPEVAKFVLDTFINEYK